MTDTPSTKTPVQRSPNLRSRVATAAIFVALVSWMTWRIAMVWPSVQQELYDLKVMNSMPADWREAGNLWLLRHEIQTTLTSTPTPQTARAQLRIVQPYLVNQSDELGMVNGAQEILRQVAHLTPQVAAWVERGAAWQDITTLALTPSVVASLNADMRKFELALAPAALALMATANERGAKDEAHLQRLLMLSHREQRMEINHMPGRLLACIQAPELVARPDATLWNGCL